MSPRMIWATRPNILHFGKDSPNLWPRWAPSFCAFKSVAQDGVKLRKTGSEALILSSVARNLRGRGGAVPHNPFVIPVPLADGPYLRDGPWLIARGHVNDFG